MVENNKALLVGAVVLLIFVVVMVAPIIEITAYHNGEVVMQSTYRLIVPETQSMIQLPLDEPVDQLDVKIISDKKTDYYLCEKEAIPTTLSEIKKQCSYMGNDGG